MSDKKWSSFPEQQMLVENWNEYLKEFFQRGDASTFRGRPSPVKSPEYRGGTRIVAPGAFKVSGTGMPQARANLLFGEPGDDEQQAGEQAFEPEEFPPHGIVEIDSFLTQINAADANNRAKLVDEFIKMLKSVQLTVSGLNEALFPDSDATRMKFGAELLSDPDRAPLFGSDGWNPQKYPILTALISQLYAKDEKNYTKLMQLFIRAGFSVKSVNAVDEKIKAAIKPKPEPKPQPGPEPEPQPGPEPKPQPGPEPKPEPEPRPEDPAGEAEEQRFTVPLYGKTGKTVEAYIRRWARSVRKKGINIGKISPKGMEEFLEVIEKWMSDVEKTYKDDQYLNLRELSPDESEPSQQNNTEKPSRIIYVTKNRTRSMRGKSLMRRLYNLLRTGAGTGGQAGMSPFTRSFSADEKGRKLASQLARGIAKFVMDDLQKQGAPIQQEESNQNDFENQAEIIRWQELAGIKKRV